MANRESRGLSGKIEISYEWEESSSSHVENMNSIELLTDGNKVILLEQNSHQNSSKNNLSRRTRKSHEIEVEKLLALIKEHGTISGQ